MAERSFVTVASTWPNGTTITDVHRWTRPRAEVQEIYAAGSQAAPSDRWDGNTMTRARRGVRLTFTFTDTDPREGNPS